MSRKDVSRGPVISVRMFANAMKPCTSERSSLVRVMHLTLYFDDAALETNHGGVGSIVSVEFREDVLDAALHGLFGD